MSSGRSSIFAFAGTRRAKWIVFAVWVVGIFIAVGPAQLATKFSDAENNESTSFLPGDAESTKVLQAAEDLQGGELAPAAIVYRRESGLTAADRQKISEDAKRLTEKRFKAVVTDGSTAAAGGQSGRSEPSQGGGDASGTPKGGGAGAGQADPPAGGQGQPEGCAGPTSAIPGQPSGYTPFVGPICSPDGKAAIVTAYLKGDGEGDSLLDPVQFWRDTVSDPGGGLQVKVTGGAGYAADAIKVFESINGTLLLAAVILVIVLLILIYRSPIFLFIPLLAVIFAEMLTRALGYGLSELGVTINGQSSSIMSILVLGAGTDYALLVVARYREELHHTEDKHEAIRAAMRSAGPAVFASAATVIAALLCLTLAKVDGTAGLGPIGAMGVACAAISMLTLLPALLTIFGRGAFWPFIPRHGTPGAGDAQGFWSRVGQRVARGPKRVMAGSLLVLGLMTAGLAFFSTDLTTNDSYRTKVESVEGQEILSKSFPAGSSVRTDVIVPDQGQVAKVIQAVEGVDGVEAVSPPVAQGERGVLVQATLDPQPYSTEAFDLIEPIRGAASDAAAGTLVGGPTAVEFDVRDAAAYDSKLIPPIVLVVVILILMVLLRAVIAPLLLIGTVILSFLASLGVGYLVFDVFFDFPGSDPSLPLFAFVFLVALGVDYNIFLVARAREETLQHGTREGMLRALAVTGGVITSAGIVLAGTFSVLAVLPLVFLTEIGFVVAFGVLLDTFLVRSVLVPALFMLLGPKVWWPSSLAHEDGSAGGQNTGSRAAVGPERPAEA